MTYRSELAESKPQEKSTDHSSGLFNDSLGVQISEKFPALVAQAHGGERSSNEMTPQEKALRIGQVSLEGLGFAVPGVWHAVKHDLDPSNWKETGMKIAGAAAMGVAMRVALPEAGAVRTTAQAVMTLCFFRDAARPLVSAWSDVASKRGDAVMLNSARKLGDNIGTFVVDGFLSSKVAQFAGLLTPVYAERYMPRQWAALENWKEAKLGRGYEIAAVEGAGLRRYGIGIEPAEATAVKNGVLNSAQDTGHCFAYVRDASGKVTNVISTGPDVEFAFESPKSNLRCALGLVPSKGNWPLVEPMRTWEWPISQSSYERAVAMIQGEKLHPGKYTPFHACPALPIQIGRKIGLYVPSGLSLVHTPIATVPLVNPWKLEQQLTKMMTPGSGSLIDFDGPALASPIGIRSH
jgi:hypothetical protein